MGAPERLPTPRTPSEQLLFDIATSLRQLTGRNVLHIDQHIHNPDPQVNLAPSEPVRLQEPEPSPGPTIVNVGPPKKGGWHELTDGQGNVIEKVRGRKKAEQRARELSRSRAS
jgi:hypothetical protein